MNQPLLSIEHTDVLRELGVTWEVCMQMPCIGNVDNVFSGFLGKARKCWSLAQNMAFESDW